MLERIETLIHQQVELFEEFRKLELSKREIEQELQAATAYIQTSREIRLSNFASKTLRN